MELSNYVNASSHPRVKVTLNAGVTITGNGTGIHSNGIILDVNGIDLEVHVKGTVQGRSNSDTRSVGSGIINSVENARIYVHPGARVLGGSGSDASGVYSTRGITTRLNNRGTVQGGPPRGTPTGGTVVNF